MSKRAVSMNDAMQTSPEIESPTRRQFIKGVAGIGTVLAAPSIFAESITTQSSAEEFTKGLKIVAQL